MASTAVNGLTKRKFNKFTDKTTLTNCRAKHQSASNQLFYIIEALIAMA